MIIFINGAFGIGKSTVAELLVKRLPNSLLYDAEEVGYFLRAVVPQDAQAADFQDLPMWRELVVTTARLLRQHYGHTLVMPMTIWHPPYFAEIVAGLRADDPNFHHIALTATIETLTARIHASNEAVEWRLAHVERCLAAHRTAPFAVQLPTDSKSPEEIVEAILRLLPVETRQLEKMV